MSAIEFGSPSAVFKYTFPAMAAGTATSVLLPNFLLGSSKITGCARTTAGLPANLGNPYIGSITPGAVPNIGSVIVLRSANGADTSTYTISWTNEAGAGLFPC